MSDIKCPYCNKPLQGKAIHISEVYMINLYHCANQDCESTEYLVGCKEFWDILGQLIHTRKVFDKAKWWVNEIVENHRYTPISTAEMALKDITALEQRESAFVHNKIKFPEHNDNLLEEFDKQFFENGQDDDLTETALEQKDK